MHDLRTARWLVVALLVGAASAMAAPPPDVQKAAALLSRYPAGTVPVDPAAMTAIHVLGERGGRAEISLLRNLAEHERDEVRTAAVGSIADIRDRQRLAQRASYARALPDPPDLADDVARLRATGLGARQAACVAYADQLLGPPPVDRDPAPRPAKGDPEELIAEGRPAGALAVLVHDPSPRARRLAARAWEDLGEPGSAVRQYALLASGGDAQAMRALERYGVDAERLLLGLYARPDEPASDAELLEVLVRRGGPLTVGALAERIEHGEASERAIATDGLARMLEGATRAEPLSAAAIRTARAALHRAADDPVESIRAIATEAL